jgi:regulator of sirC expression with transglutaminase-like and TPR domain
MAVKASSHHNDPKKFTPRSSGRGAASIPARAGRRRWLPPILPTFLAITLFVSVGTALLYDERVDYVNNPAAVKDYKIDVGIAALTCCKLIHPEARIAYYSKKLDALAAQVRALVGDSKDPVDILIALKKVLFEYEGFGYDREGVKRNDPDVSLLTHLLDTKLGNCFALPTLYMAVAQRLGYPIFMVSVPGHAYIRYVDSDNVFNIEATAKGRIYSDDSYIEEFSVSKEAVGLGAYGRALSNREFLGELLTETAFFFKGGMKEERRALSLLENAVKLNPLSPYTYASLATVHSSLSFLCKGKEAREHFDASVRYEKMAHELGYVPTDETAYAKTMKEPDKPSEMVGKPREKKVPKEGMKS